MEILIGYGGVAVFLIVLLVVLQRTKGSIDFSEYATAGRSFGPLFSSMAFVNTWLPGTIFIAFAGYAASAGAIGFYFVAYSILAVVLMFLLAKPVHQWGRQFDLRTQADLLGLRYGSTAVRVVAAVIGVIASFPWIVLGMQSLTLVFGYLSFGAVPTAGAAFIGIGVLVARQWWTVRLGARGLVVSDFVQGIVAYLVGTVLILGLLTWLLTHGHGFGEVDPAFFTLPGPGSVDGPLYLFSLIATGALGGWCWPDIFVRLFASNSTHTIKRAAVMASPLLLIFGSSLCLLAVAASTYPGVADAPDEVWFLTASIGGPVILTLAGVCVLAATMGNVGANLQALGAQIANDVVAVAHGTRLQDPRSGKIAVGALTLLAGAVAVATTDALSSGMVALAQVSYQGVVQLAPTVFLGIFWRRGNTTAAVAAMIVGFGTACVLQMLYPIAIPMLGGMTSGVAALGVNFAVYIVVSYAVPHSAEEKRRVNQLFDSLHTTDKVVTP